MKMFVQIKLDKNRNLRFGMLALMKIEEELGENIANLNFDKLKLKDMVTILACGLDEDMDYMHVAELVDEYSDVKTVMAKLGEALALAFGEEEGKKNVETKNEQEPQTLS